MQIEMEEIMKRFSAILFLFLSFFVQLAAAQTAERPKIRINESWSYVVKDERIAAPPSEYSLKVTNVTEEKVEMQRKDQAGKQQVFAVDKDLNTPPTKNGYTTKTLIFPLFVGKTWDYSFTMVGGTWQRTDQVTATVTAYEKVTVPAGTYDAFKVVLRSAFTVNDPTAIIKVVPGVTTTTVWYAPKVGNVVRVVYTTTSPMAGISSSPVTRELTAFEPGIVATTAESTLGSQIVQ